MGLTIAGANVRPLDKDNGHTGIALPNFPTAAASGALALIASRGFIMRFVPSRNMTITAIGFVVTAAAGANDNVDVGIYDATTATKIVSSGATAGKLNGTGTQSVTITSTPLTAGTVYYAAISSGTQGGTAASLGAASGGSVQNAALFGTTAGIYDFDVKASQHPLPSSWGAVGQLSAGLPLLALRES